MGQADCHQSGQQRQGDTETKPLTVAGQAPDANQQDQQKRNFR